MENFDPTLHPLRAIRDLIEVCELTGSDDEILERARIGFATLRRIFGDDRPNEAMAFELPVEPTALLAGINAPLAMEKPHA